MKEIHEEAAEQMHERIGNVVTQLQAYRAQHLEDTRLERMLTQLELIDLLIAERGHLEYRQKQALDFHLIEGSVLEGNEFLERELYSIRNFVENAL